MWISSLSITDFRAITETGRLELRRLNVLLGPNNAGKSSVLRALLATQEPFPIEAADVRLGAEQTRLSAEAHDIPQRLIGGAAGQSGELTLSFTRGVGGPSLELKHAGGTSGIGRFPSEEPLNWIYPFLSGRKTYGYEEAVNQATVRSVSGSLRNLPAKLTRLGNPAFPAHGTYAAACEQILGFVVTHLPSPNGVRAGVYTPTGEEIGLDRMGEGVANIVGLLADLCLADGKVFLLEEPENDIHPEALKALMGVIQESAERNQFIVSTHSHLVARYLGAGDSSTLYYIESDRQLPPTANIGRVGDSPEERIEVLAKLGYELWDFDLWDGWLFLEESSAERIIRDYLVPWFAEKLTRVRTVAAGGTGKVERQFDEFNRLFLYAHLQERYRNRAWVVLDGDDSGIKVVEKLRTRYEATWEPDRFDNWSAADFESFYPREFATRVDEVLALAGQAKRDAKKKLLNEVVAWLEQDPDRGRAELAASAREVIDRLRAIEATLFPVSKS